MVSEEQVIDDLLEAVLAERRFEKRARGRAWAERAFWDAYLDAVLRRRKAVDAYLRKFPDEVESVPLFR